MLVDLNFNGKYVTVVGGGCFYSYSYRGKYFSASLL